MNKIFNLFNENFVNDFFVKKILPLYPNFLAIKKIKIIPHKKHIWEHTYHVVIEFSVTFSKINGQKITLPIFCTAHSDEPRKNVYTSLKYLWSRGFASDHLSIPHPLFYSHEFKGTFYRGVTGHHLYYYIRNNRQNIINQMIPQTAQWFAKLHSLNTNNSKNFNKNNSRIKTVTPGVKHILARIKNDYQEYFNFYQQAYHFFIEQENNFLNSTKQKWLVHGDAHPENIIRMSPRKIAVIDFTDLCLSDFARDLGTFTQQLEYMMNRKIGDTNYTQKTIQLFINSYFIKIKNVTLNNNISQRISNYYNWTSLRTATHFLLKENPEPKRAKYLIKQIKNNLNF